MGQCFCTGACRRGEGCTVTPARDVPGVYTVPVPRPWVTAKEVRQIVREEIRAAMRPAASS